MTANRFIGEVDAPEFGDGFTIRLDMNGQAKLEAEHGEFEFLGKVYTGLVVLSAKYITSFLSVALRDANGAVVGDVPAFSVPIEVVGRKCLDAFCLCRYGKDNETWVASNEKAKKANPSKATKA